MPTRVLPGLGGNENHPRAVPVPQSPGDRRGEVRPRDRRGKRRATSWGQGAMEPGGPQEGTESGDGVASAVPGPESGPREVGGAGPAGGARGSRPALCAPSDPPLRDLAPPQIPGGPSAPRPGVAPAGPPAARTHRAPRRNLPSLECRTRGRADSFPESDATTAPEVPPEAMRLPGHAQSLGNRRGLETPQAGACWEL